MTGWSGSIRLCIRRFTRKHIGQRCLQATNSLIRDRSMSSNTKKYSLHSPDKDSGKAEKAEDAVNADRLTELLSGYDVISFDLFDTLITRPFDTPQELFSLVGEQLGVADFKKKRIEAEIRARQKRFQSSSGASNSGIRRLLIRFWNKFSVIVGGDTVGDYEVKQR